LPPAERYRELLDNQIVPHIGAKAIQKLKSLDIEAWHTKLRKSGRKDGKGGVSGQTIRQAHRVLSKALREAARHDLVVKNVAAEEGAPKVSNDEMVILTEDQLTDLPAKLTGYAIRPRAITAVYTGIRRGELLALRWKNVDLDAKVIRIRESLEETRARSMRQLRFKAPKTKQGVRDITLPTSWSRRSASTARASLRHALSLGSAGSIQIR
jgi:integrase